jgi:Rho-binding antiterminator
MITCTNYDYVEIACLHKYPVRLILKDGTEKSGIAFDTTVNEKREECIVIKGADQKENIILSHIALMIAQVENPHFKQIKFT